MEPPPPEPSRARRLAARSYVVTGAGSGIGAAIARRIAVEGADVVVVGRTEAPLRAVADRIGADGARAHVAAGDVGHEATAQRACAAAADVFGGLDGFVHCAGEVVRGVPLEATTRAQWDATMDAHVRALHWLVRAAVPLLRARGGGSVVTVASNLGLLAIPGLAAYSAAKGAVISLTRALAVELGPDGIRVNALCPGLVETPATAGSPRFDENRRGYGARAPLRRIGRPEDVAGAAAFLLGDDSRWLTGQALVVDGGYAIA